MTVPVDLRSSSENDYGMNDSSADVFFILIVFIAVVLG